MKTDIENKEVELNVEGMTCSSCAMTVTKFLEKRGMKEVYVDFSSGAVKFQPNGNFNAVEISNGIEGLGYHVNSKSTVESTNGIISWMKTLDAKFYLSLVFTIPLLLHMVLPLPFLHNPVVQLLLCLPVMLIGWQHFGKSAFGSLREGVPNMDVLIFVGSSAAFIYSVVGLFIYHDANYLFFETAASIITLVLLGNLIEKRSVKRTRSAVTELNKLQPQKAKRIDFYGDEAFEVISEVDHHDIKTGDYFLVNTGDRIPADGKIVWGNGWADESMITGESIPVEKKNGDALITGTVLHEGTVKMKALATGKQTVLAHIIELVNDAQRNKPDIQRLADKITAIFVPVVFMISVVTFISSYFLFDLSFRQSLMSSIGVLVISCPCAMGLATPTAVMVGIGRAAKKGILIKGAQSLETLISVKAIVFDKTGTLTTGKFKIKRMQSLGISETDLKSILVSVEKFSSHPIAASLVDELKNEISFSLHQVSEKKGVSISGFDEAGNKYEAGSYQIAKDHTNDPSFNVYVLKNDQLVGMAEVRDEIRGEAKTALEYFKKSGIKTVLLSGDREAACNSIAAELGIDVFYAEKSPEEKLNIIHQLMHTSAVAMVGDGVNDAPALTAATIGISLSNATQIAIDAAQIILLHNDLGLLPEAFRISKHTLLTIKQNLFWAFCYNIIAIPIAAFGLLRPVVGAASMAFSDVMVIGNSLRLRAKKLS
ncbi:MAG: cadmium-translocating P-type ATPase [Chitinophagaceae bacterium]|nr:cadmium-translocating P-type ATPase [Chitinophagaceae bacterium]